MHSGVSLRQSPATGAGQSAVDWESWLGNTSPQSHQAFVRSSAQNETVFAVPSHYEAAAKYVAALVNDQ